MPTKTPCPLALALLLLAACGGGEEEDEIATRYLDREVWLLIEGPVDRIERDAVPPFVQVFAYRAPIRCLADHEKFTGTSSPDEERGPGILTVLDRARVVEVDEIFVHLEGEGGRTPMPRERFLSSLLERQKPETVIAWSFRELWLAQEAHREIEGVFGNPWQLASRLGGLPFLHGQEGDPEERFSFTWSGSFSGDDWNAWAFDPRARTRVLKVDPRGKVMVCDYDLPHHPPPDLLERTDIEWKAWAW